MGIFCNAISGTSAQREGVQRAKSEGKYRGRSQTALAKTDQVIELLQAGKTHRCAGAGNQCVCAAFIAALTSAV